MSDIKEIVKQLNADDVIAAYNDAKRKAERIYPEAPEMYVGMLTEEALRMIHLQKTLDFAYQGGALWRQ